MSQVIVTYHNGSVEVFHPETTQVFEGVLHLYAPRESDLPDLHIPLVSIRKWETHK